jgi:hypothetical protein
MTDRKRRFPVLPVLGGAGVVSLVLAMSVVSGGIAGGSPGSPAARAQVATSTPAPTPTSTPPPVPGRTAPRPDPPGWNRAEEEAKWRDVARKPKERPAPRVHGSFASELSGERKRIPRRPQPPAPVPPDVDGCNRAYGNAAQCIPSELPPGQTDYCEYLRSHGFPPVRVNGSDPERLDADGNGIACG